jgi:hypothetical protein
MAGEWTIYAGSKNAQVIGRDCERATGINDAGYSS